MYLHMLIPSQKREDEYIINKSINSTKEVKQVYYEVGCRVLELNKIYK